SRLIDEEVRKLIDKAYDATKDLLTRKDREVKVLAEALLEREVLFQSDVEALIGKRPYEEKRLLDVDDHGREGLAPGDSNGVPPAVVTPPTAEQV
ncbi:MAG TPA: AAA family ATPase, partial [Puia sp.]